jgi:hypothetical protein
MPGIASIRIISSGLLSVIALDAAIGVGVATSKRFGRKYQQCQYYDCDSHKRSLILSFPIFEFDSACFTGGCPA